jgi:hypothetical protein
MALVLLARLLSICVMRASGDKRTALLVVFLCGLPIRGDGISVDVPLSEFIGTVEQLAGTDIVKFWLFYVTSSYSLCSCLLMSKYLTNETKLYLFIYEYVRSFTE